MSPPSALVPSPSSAPSALVRPSSSPEQGPPIRAPTPHKQKSSPLIAPTPSPALQLLSFQHLPFADDGYFPPYEPHSAASTPESPGVCTPPFDASAATTPESPGPPRTPPTLYPVAGRPRTPRQPPWTGREAYDPRPTSPSYRPTPPPPPSPAEHRCGCSFDFATGGMSVSRADLAFILVAWGVQNAR